MLQNINTNYSINESVYSDYELAEEGNNHESTDDTKFDDLLAQVDQLFEEGDEGRRQAYHLLNDVCIFYQ